MVDYCERHSINVIHQENRRECCDELIDKIIKVWGLIKFLREEFF